MRNNYFVEVIYKNNSAVTILLFRCCIEKTTNLNMVYLASRKNNVFIQYNYGVCTKLCI